MNFFARQKFRFDLGSGFMQIVTLAFVVIAASDRLAYRFNVASWVMVLILVPGAVLAVWLFGWVLDKMRFEQAYQEEKNQRNEMLRQVHVATALSNMKVEGVEKLFTEQPVKGEK